MSVKKRVEPRVPFPAPVQRSTNYKPFLAVMGIIFLLSFIGILNQVEKATLTGHAVQTISYAKEGSLLHFEVKTGGIKDAVVHFKEDTKNAKITFDEVDSFSWKPEGAVYSLIKIISEDQSKFSSIDFTLKLEEQVLLNKGIAVGDVQLYVNGNPLETTFVKTEDRYVYYTVTSQELGDFAIGRAKPSEKSAVGEAIKEPTAEEVPSEEIVTEEKPIPPVEEKPAPVVKERSFWQKVVEFWRGLFD